MVPPRFIVGDSSRVVRVMSFKHESACPGDPDSALASCVPLAGTLILSFGPAT